jgi:hypothetical protein
LFVLFIYIKRLQNCIIIYYLAPNSVLSWLFIDFAYAEITN